MAVNLKKEVTPNLNTRVIKDAATNRPLSQATIDAMLQKQEKTRKAYILRGQVAEKSDDSLILAVSVGDTSYVLPVTFSPKMVFSQEVSAPGDQGGFSRTEEVQISLANVQVGAEVSLMFSGGVLLAEINDTESLEADRLVVNLPHSPGFLED
ncbi:MAG: hypothetical protein HYT94_02280 [Parcubacteria group bacterium]|nr:hypothetical protein [Parcubacteria group bacterium]